MATPVLATKLHIPPTRPDLVARPRLTKQLNECLHRKLILLSAPAGFGKTTLVSEWVAAGAGQGPPAAWLSLDEGDNDLSRFLVYLVAALQTVAPETGKGVLDALRSPRPPPVESMLAGLLNDITAIPDDFVLVLDDYHLIESQEIDRVLTFVLDHLPHQMHLVIASRMDPTLPLARLRAGGQMTEIRETDLRFTLNETDAFLDRVMGLSLSAQNLAALEARTEGWIAGLQLAALSMRELEDGDEIADFVNRFTGSDRYIQDYLTDEVLRQRPQGAQDFLLQTSILERLTAPLCDAVRFGPGGAPAAAGEETSQAVLEALDAANLFIVPLDNERRWYRYHGLFADLLRQRLHQQQPDAVGELHMRASAWYEDHGLEVEALHHAAAAKDVGRAARLVAGEGMPLHFRGAVAPVLNWLESLPTTVLDAMPSLWVTYASALSLAGQNGRAEQKLRAAEAALQGADPDDETQDLIGHIAAVRATLAVGEQQAETIVAQSRRALAYLHPDNLPVRTATTWKLGVAHQLQGNRAGARRAYTEAISVSRASGNLIVTLLATIGLGTVQEAENRLYLAAETYRRALQLVEDRPLPAACEAHLGLARILYQWNDLDAAQEHGQQSVQLAKGFETTDRCVSCEVFLARLQLARGDAAGAAAILAKTEQFVRRHQFAYRMPEVAAGQVLTLLRQGNLAAAAHLAQTHDLPLSQARVYLAQGDASGALAVLAPLRRQVEAKGWADETLRVMVLQAVAYQAHGERERALRRLTEALALAEPGGFIRLFVDEGMAMARLLSKAAARGVMPPYVDRLLAAFEAERGLSSPALRRALAGRQTGSHPSPLPPVPPLVEPLSQRELEVLQLVAQGLSNREIGERLFLALSTVKGHNRNIFGKLGVQRRTEAVARARQLRLL